MLTATTLDRAARRIARQLRRHARRPAVLAARFARSEALLLGLVAAHVGPELAAESDAVARYLAFTRFLHHPVA